VDKLLDRWRRISASRREPAKNLGGSCAHGGPNGVGRGDGNVIVWKAGGALGMEHCSRRSASEMKASSDALISLA